MKKSQKTKYDFLKEVTEKVLQKIDPKDPNRPKPEEIGKTLLEELSFSYEVLHNAVCSKGTKWQIPQELPVPVLVDMITYLEPVKRIRWLKGNGASSLMIYQTEGEKKGLYVDDKAEIGKIVTKYSYGISERDLCNVITRLEREAPLCDRTVDTNLVPVNNGIFNLREKKLMPFSPDYVYLSKFPIDYNPSAYNVNIHNDEDGTDWDVESWITSLSDDAGVPELLWEVIAAAVRPNRAWNKIVCPYDTAGCNGKGTFTQMIRSLCGRNNVAEVSISDFANRFLPSDFLHALTVLVDENDVKVYAKSAKALKCAATGDPISVEVKYKDPVSYAFRGLIIECFNGFPRFEDQTSSLYRRFLLIPFPKCFLANGERTYIKEDYVNRPEVLEYVLYKALNMEFVKFSEPPVCKKLLEEFKSDNDPIRQFMNEILDELAWDFIPNAFLYDLYLAWYTRNVSLRGNGCSKKTFIQTLKAVIGEPGSDYAVSWKIHDDKHKKIFNPYGLTEPLATEYGLSGWIHPIVKKCTGLERILSAQPQVQLQPAQPQVQPQVQPQSAQPQFAQLRVQLQSQPVKQPQKWEMLYDGSDRQY